MWGLVFTTFFIYWAEYKPECDIRENFDTNECPNIFVSTKLHEWISEYIHTNFFDTNECPNKYSYWKLHEYSNIFEYSSRFYTLTHSPTNVRIYSYKQIWHERMSEYIRKRKIDTNECPNIYSWPIYSNIQIYSSHSDTEAGGLQGFWLGQYFRNFLCPKWHDILFYAHRGNTRYTLTDTPTQIIQGQSDVI